MPIALLLQETTAAFRFGARVLDPWNHLVRVEELLIDRARGAFLVRWFGERIPLHGAAVRVVITNLEALRNRYLLVRRQFLEAEEAARGPNLTEPLFGLAGVLAGILVTPGVALGASIAVLRKVNLSWWKQILVALAGIVAPVVAALSPALAVAGFAGETLLGITNDPSARALFDFLGETAKLLKAARKFISLLLGPREAIKNPVLKGMLGVADQLAKLVPFGLAVLALGVTRFGPLLLPLVAQAGPFMDLVSASTGTISFILDDFVTQIKEALTGPENIVSVLKRVIANLTRPIRPAIKVFKGFLAEARVVIKAWYQDVRTQVEAWRKAAGPQLKNSLKMIPLYLRMTRIQRAFEIAGKLFSSATAGPVSKSSTKPNALDKWMAKAKALGADADKLIKSFPELPHVESPADMIERLGLVEAYGIPSDIRAYKELIKGRLPPVSPEVERYVERARHPASAFAFERKALKIELGKEPREALVEAREKELELRSLIEAVVGRVLPAELRSLMPSLVGAFAALDESLTQGGKKPEKKPGKKEEKKKAELPVKELPEDNGRLLPVVGRLVIRSQTGRRDDLYDFMVRLQKKLDRPYPAPA